MIKIVFLIFNLFIITSCLNYDSKKPHIKIINQGEITIDSVYIIAKSGTSMMYSSDTLKFINLEINKHYINNLIFKNVKSDGGIACEVYINGKLKFNKGIDYFTNGASMKKEYIINIKNDTVIVTHSKF